MVEKLHLKQTVDFKELLISNMIEIQAIAQLLIKKGIISEQEYFTELKQVQLDYENKKAST